jgi:3-mercaptopyruvate sulfurtransferase SseA
MLAAQGVKNVRALAGGWNQWVADGNPVVKSPNGTAR